MRSLLQTQSGDSKLRHIYERFEEDEWKKLQKAKTNTAKSRGLKRISWHDFILVLAEFD
jgi:hypothetical protein